MEPLVLRCGEKPCHWRCQAQTSRLDFGPRRELTMQKEMLQETEKQSSQTQMDENHWTNATFKAFKKIQKCTQNIATFPWLFHLKHWQKYGQKSLHPHYLSGNIWFLDLSAFVMKTEIFWSCYLRFSGVFTQRNTLFFQCVNFKNCPVKMSRIPKEFAVTGERVPSIECSMS